MTNSTFYYSTVCPNTSQFTFGGNVSHSIFSTVCFDKTLASGTLSIFARKQRFNVTNGKLMKF